MPIEVKEITVKTTVTEQAHSQTLNEIQINKLRAELINEIKQQIQKTEKNKKRR